MRPGFRAMVLLGIALLLPLEAAPARASAAARDTVSGAGGGNPRVYRVEWRRELSIVAAAAVAAASGQFVHGIGRDPCPCDAGGINALDRHAAGNRNAGAGHASDALLGALLVAPFFLDAHDLTAHAGRTGIVAEDALVVGEAIALDAGINQVVKKLAHRPRPRLYGLAAGDPAYRDPGLYRSFYSLHTSVAFATAAGVTRTWTLRHPGGASRWWVGGATLAAAGAVGALRVAAGEHFPTDVLAAAVAGTANGIVVPALHRPGGWRFSMTPVEGGLLCSVAAPLR